MKPSNLLSPLAALALAGGVALTALPALAQDAQRPFGLQAFRAGPGAPGLQHPGNHRPDLQRFGAFGGHRRGANLPRFADPTGMACRDDAAARIEAIAAYVAARLDLTDAQAEHLATLEANALEAQALLADLCPTAPEESADNDNAADRPDLLDRLADYQASTRARADALDLVVPALETFYSSLSGEQRETLFPAPPHRPNAARGADRTAPGADAPAQTDADKPAETPAG